MTPSPPSPEFAEGAADLSTAPVSVAEAARRLGVGRARVYQLINVGALDTAGTQPLRISQASIERRLHTAPAVGAPLAPLGA